MARRYTRTRREIEDSRIKIPQLDPPPSSTFDFIPKKRSTYGLQRDYRVLEREKKVSTALKNEDFRSRLETILQGQLEGENKPRLKSVPSQWLEDRSLSQGRQKSRQVGWNNSEAVITPINDLQGIHVSKYTLAEREVRCKLAAVYRLVAMFGWSQLIFNHITACAPGKEGNYFINAFGLMYHEVTASNMVCVDLEGNITDPGTTQLGVNKSGIALHSAIHKARRNIKCVIHLSNNAGIAISSMNCGLLPISREAAAIGNVSYCDYCTLESKDLDSEMAGILSFNKVLILRHHGVVAVGETIEEAFSIAHNLVKACEIQVAAMPAGLGNLSLVPQSSVWDNCNFTHVGTKWKEGELEFEALMRMLDSMGYRTGYNYKCLDLLQPGRANENALDFLEDKKKSETEQIVIKSKKTPMEPEKELWEFLERKPKIPASVKNGVSVSLLRDNEAAVTRETEHIQDQGISDQGENKLSSLQETAERVAKSTSDTVQKLALEREVGSPLKTVQQTAERGAESTGDSIKKLAMEREVGNPLKTVQQTAERVARSTGDAIQKLTLEKEEGNPLDRAQKAAERVARSTGDAVERLTQSQLNAHPPNNYEMQKVSFADPSSSDALKFTAQHVAKSTEKSLEMLSSDESRNPLAYELKMASNESIRQLSSLPEDHKANKIIGRLPNLPPTNDQKMEKLNGLSNGYHQSPLFRRQKWSEIANNSSSDSEYSTTESDEIRGGEKRIFPRHHRTSAANSGDPDLEINPLERMTNTAEIVAESTGKAVHRLTTTLPEF